MVMKERYTEGRDSGVPGRTGSGEHVHGPAPKREEQLGEHRKGLEKVVHLGRQRRGPEGGGVCSRLGKAPKDSEQGRLNLDLNAEKMPWTTEQRGRQGAMS